MVNLMQAAAGPYMLGQDKGNLQGFTAFPAVGLVTVWIAWAMIRLPETKGIPQGIVDTLFERGTSARMFHSEAKQLRVMNGQVDGAPGVVVASIGDGHGVV